MLSTALQKNWLQFYLFFSTWFTLPIYTFCIQCLDYDRMCTFYYRINRVITIKTHNRTEGDHFMRCQSRNISHHLRFFFLSLLLLPRCKAGLNVSRPLHSYACLFLHLLYILGSISFPPTCESDGDLHGIFIAHFDTWTSLNIALESVGPICAYD